MLDEPARRAEIDASLQDVYRTLFLTSNPTCTKAALNLLGRDVGGLRLPLVEADESELAIIRGALERQGLLTGAHAALAARCASSRSEASAGAAGRGGVSFTSRMAGRSDFLSVGWGRTTSACTCSDESSISCSRRATFALHLHDMGDTSPDVWHVL